MPMHSIPVQIHMVQNPTAELRDIAQTVPSWTPFLKHRNAQSSAKCFATSTTEAKQKSSCVAVKNSRHLFQKIIYIALHMGWVWPTNELIVKDYTYLWHTYWDAKGQWWCFSSYNRAIYPLSSPPWYAKNTRIENGIETAFRPFSKQKLDV